MGSIDTADPSMKLKTRVLPVNTSNIGTFVFSDTRKSFLYDWELDLSTDSPDAKNLEIAAQELRTGEVPVAFPTETVYGLGADATRSPAVRGIYRAKQRPSDNPLIVHISSLSQLRHLLRRPKHPPSGSDQPENDRDRDPIPSIYLPLISKYWPGPLTILLPLPTPSPFAPEVTNHLPTVGVRMPSSLLALALIKLSDRPLAAPSANASSRPSPTTAAHVLHDLDGRIQTILDGGSCTVGLESTVVDGLSDPPAILRPGAISIDMLRECAGWEGVRVGYADRTQSSGGGDGGAGGATAAAPRAPGMKYKHYSPKAKVVITKGRPTPDSIKSLIEGKKRVGIMRTTSPPPPHSPSHSPAGNINNTDASPPTPHMTTTTTTTPTTQTPPEIFTTDLGIDMTSVARNLFAGLRELDLKDVEIIFVEGMADREGVLVAAVMNRLRKAAEVEDVDVDVDVDTQD